MLLEGFINAIASAKRETKEDEEICLDLKSKEMKQIKDYEVTEPSRRSEEEDTHIPD